MTKEQAFDVAEKFLLHIYSEDVIICANICTAVADKNTFYISKSLDEVIKLCESIKDGLKE